MTEIGSGEQPTGVSNQPSPDLGVNKPVEKRSFARTEMMSCCEYFTVLAPPGFTWAGVASSQMKQRVTTARLNLRTNLAFLKTLYLNYNI